MDHVEPEGGPPTSEASASGSGTEHAQGDKDSPGTQAAGTAPQLHGGGPETEAPLRLTGEGARPPDTIDIQPAKLVTREPPRRLTAEGSQLLEAAISNYFKSKFGFIAISAVALLSVLGLSVQSIVERVASQFVEAEAKRIREELESDQARIERTVEAAEALGIRVNEASAVSREAFAATEARLHARYEQALDSIQQRESELIEIKSRFQQQERRGAETLRFLEDLLNRSAEFNSRKAEQVSRALMGSPSFAGQIEAAVRSVPVGTVLPSLLPPDKFMTLVGEKGNFDPMTSRWTLADGRQVEGSAFSRASLQSRVPDLRGMFLRGTNEGRADGLQDLGERESSGFQPAAVGKHSHPGVQVIPTGFEIRQWILGHSANRLAENSEQANVDTKQGVPRIGPVLDFSDQQRVGPLVRIPDFGDVESRPKNVGVTFYVRIN